MTAALAPDAPQAGLSARAVSVTYRNGVPTGSLPGQLVRGRQPAPVLEAVA